MARRSGRFKAVDEVDDNIEVEGMLIHDHLPFSSSVIYKAIRRDDPDELDKIKVKVEGGKEGKLAAVLFSVGA